MSTLIHTLGNTTVEADMRVHAARVSCQDEIRDAISAALEWIGWETIVEPNARVFLKPNLTWATHSPGVTTLPAVLEAVVSVVRTRTCKITIGESDGGYHAFRAEEAFRNHGVYEIADRYDAQVVNLSRMETEVAETSVESRNVQVELPSLLLHDVDVFISIPVLKVHAMTRVSLGFKNQWGCIPDAMRLRYHPEFNLRIVAINKILNPQIAVYDGTYFLDKNGPIAGEAIQMDLLIVADDIGAGDFVSCGLMGIDPNRIGHFRVARTAKMFPSSLDEVRLNDDFQHLKGRKLHLRRSLINWVALWAFNSKPLTRLLYDSAAGRLLHKAFFVLRRNPLVERLLCGKFRPPSTREGVEK